MSQFMTNCDIFRHYYYNIIGVVSSIKILGENAIDESFIYKEAIVNARRTILGKHDCGHSTVLAHSYYG